MFRRFAFFAPFALIILPLCAAGQADSTSTAARSGQTIRANTDLVVVDVVVADAKQNPVHHLTADKFTLLEDGKPQTLKVFEEHTIGPAAPLPPLPKLGPGVFTNYTPTPPNGALNILLFDKLNTPIDAQAFVRDQVLKYLKEMQPGTRVAIFTLTTRLSLLQGFTSDPELLRSLVEGKKGNPGASPVMNNPVEGDQPGADDPMNTTNDILGNDPDAATMLASLQQFEAEDQSFQTQVRQRYTLDAFNQLARYMSALPGRKNLIWFSGSFPIDILPDTGLANPFAVFESAEGEFRETVDRLSRSQVAVYPIDARGLMGMPTFDASQRGSRTSARSAMQFMQKTGSEHSTMQEMAQATGGKAFVNTNGLKEAIGGAIDAGSNYYTVAYTPSNRNWNGNYRKIEVKLDRPGVSLSYRRGYFADALTNPAHSNQPEKPTADALQYSAIRNAMTRGGPDPTEIIFIADVRPTTLDPEPSLAPGNRGGQKISGPYRRYTITFISNPKEMSWPTTPDGAHHCALEFLTFVYDSEGTLVNAQTNGFSINIPDAEYAPLLNRRMTYHQQISVPAKGEYYLRIGMRDQTTDRIGALELPIASVAKLQPASARESASASTPLK